MRSTIYIFSILGFALTANAQTVVSELTHTVGTTSYTSSDHRSNVYAVVADRKMWTNGQFTADMLSHTDYYPYGMQLASARRTNASDPYRFGLQGQEQDHTIKGIGNSLSYTYRMHDPRIGRFFAVDPLHASYPELSTYQFSANRVVDAVELEGLEMFSVHGTKQGENYSNIFTKETYEAFAEVYGNTTNYYNTSFSWKGFAKQLNNRDTERKMAAIKLAIHVYKTRKWALKHGHITADEPITLVGYSHGGNVSIQAAEYIEKLTGKKVNLITVATPAYNDGSVEDPAENTSIRNHTHLYSLADGVDGIAYANPEALVPAWRGPVGNETYDNNKTKNYSIPTWFIPNTGWKDTHSTIGERDRNQKLALFIQLYILQNTLQIKFTNPPKYKPQTLPPPTPDETGAAGHRQ